MSHNNFKELASVQKKLIEEYEQLLKLLENSEVTLEKIEPFLTYTDVRKFLWYRDSEDGVVKSIPDRVLSPVKTNKILAQYFDKRPHELKLILSKAIKDEFNDILDQIKQLIGMGSGYKR